jgi:hypothetical protein
MWLLDNPGNNTHGQGVCFGHRTMVDEPGSCYGLLPVQLPRCSLVRNEMLQGYKTRVTKGRLSVLKGNM